MAVTPLRLFFGIALPDEVREILVASAETLKTGDMDGLRWVRPADLHLTVRFIGSVPAGDVPSLLSGVARAITPMAPLSLSLSRFGCFPDRGPVRIVWAGVKERCNPDGSDPHFLTKLADETERAVSTLGYPPEPRSFSPHITLCRIKGERPLQNLRVRLGAASIASIDFTISELTLFESRSFATRSDLRRYHPLETIPFTEGPHP